ncbi:MAG: hypothetical protein R3C44_15020 [Chloroflexota bacterium]
MKLIGRILIILVAAAVVVGITFALVNAGVLGSESGFADQKVSSGSRGNRREVKPRSE